MTVVVEMKSGEEVKPVTPQLVEGNKVKPEEVVPVHQQIKRDCPLCSLLADEGEQTKGSCTLSWNVNGSNINIQSQEYSPWREIAYWIILILSVVGLWHLVSMIYLILWC